ncbi:MAG: ubiquinone biosynthesis accessory factor UbiJ [Steroidobacteraceae bacterium]
MTPELLRPFEKILNRHIAASSRARRLLAELDGRSMELRFAATPVRLRLVATADGISVRSASEEPADAVIEGTPLAFGRLAIGDPKQSIRAGGMEIHGDAEIAEGFRKLLSAARPDLEEELSRLTGDVAAHYLAGFARDAIGFGRRARDTFAQNVAEYLTEESRDLPVRIEVEEFLADVDRLREAVDRLDARLIEVERARSGR